MAMHPGDAFARLSPPGPKACKICGALALVYGEVDFNKSCAEAIGTVLPRSGIAIAYNRCPKCEFLFSTSFDRWTTRDFLENIYNDRYAAIDPDYEAVRPAASAALLDRAFETRKAEISILDYGGGNGALARRLVAAGFRSAETYDPLVAEFATLPSGKFSVLACFETLEHTPDPLGAIKQITTLVDEPGIVVLSTVVQPADFAVQGLGWWYVGPRNGHISIFSRQSLVAAWSAFGFTVASVDHASHVAFRKIPDFARHLFGQT